MGEIRTTVDPAADLTVVRARGEVTADEILDAVEQFYTGERTSRVLWDFTEASLRAIGPEDVERIAAFTVNHARAEGGGWMTALVLPESLGFGLGRMFEMLREASLPDVKTRTFRGLAEARAWLGLDEG